MKTVFTLSALALAVGLAGCSDNSTTDTEVTDTESAKPEAVGGSGQSVFQRLGHTV